MESLLWVRGQGNGTEGLLPSVRVLGQPQPLTVSGAKAQILRFTTSLFRTHRDPT